jgi:O-antigen ligase
MAMSLLAVLALCAWGFKQGGDLQMAKIQVQTFVLALVLAYLCAISFRGARDHRLVGVLILWAACIKAVYAVCVYATVPPGSFETTDGRLAYVTSHGDSMLFAYGTVVLIVALAEQPSRRNAVLAVFLLPLLVAAMQVNNRRLVWVELAAAVLTYWMVSRRSKVKRVAVRAVLVAVPLILVYVAAGWNSHSRVFAPVKLFRSVSDSDVDASTLYRDLENYNLLATMRENPWLGLGFGHPFAEPVKLPDISFFKEYRYMPHNSLLGLWAFCGPLGFTGLWGAVVVGVFLAARSYTHARAPDERVAAFMTLAVVVIFFVHCWGDIGFSERRGIYLLGPALAIAGQMALSTGAWGAHAAGRRT